MSGKLLHNKALLLIDGECALCNKWAQYIARHDKQGLFIISSLQSPHAHEALQQYGFSDKRIKTVLLLWNEQIYTESDAVLTALKLTARHRRLAAALLSIPPSIRNAAYRLVARTRRMFFGTSSSCPVYYPKDYL